MHLTHFMLFLRRAQAHKHSLPQWLTEQQCDGCHDDDESDEADAHAGARHGSRLWPALGEGVADADGDVDLGKGAQGWGTGIHNLHGHRVLAHLQLYQGVEPGVGLWGEEDRGGNSGAELVGSFTM